MTLFQNEDTFKDGNEYACRIIGAGIQESPSVGTFCIVVWHATSCYKRITDSICEFLCQIYAVSNEEVPTYKTTALAKSVDLYTYEILLSATVSKTLYIISPNGLAARNAHSLYLLHICSGAARRSLLIYTYKCMCVLYIHICMMDCIVCERKQ